MPKQRKPASKALKRTVAILFCAVAVMWGVVLWGVPLIGPVLAIILFAIALFLLIAAFANAPKKSGHELQTELGIADTEQQPSGGIVAGHGVERITSLVREEVVGESGYQAEIAGIVARRGRELTALLEPIDGGDTVRVLLMDGTDFTDGMNVVVCGFLTRETAAEFLPEIRAIRGRGNFVQTPAAVFGGERPERPSYGVWVGESYA